MPSSHFFAVIMAGGSGTRLWPLSRKTHPKQFHAFLGDQTMLQETYERLTVLLPPEHIYISTGVRSLDLVRANLPALPMNRIILEPDSRNTGPAIGLAALTIEAEHPGAIIATIASDHAIQNPDEFRATLQAAFESAEARPDAIVTVGINPTRPDTGFGYIQLGAAWRVVAGKRVFTIESFKEKPDHKTAESYLRSFDYLWNAGYFIFRASAMREWLTLYAPTLLEGLTAIREHAAAGTLEPKVFAELYGTLENVAIEPLIVEQLPAESRLVIPAPLEWSDVGNWKTLYEFITESTGKRSVIHGKHIGLGDKNIFVQGGERLIATIGLEDIVIVDTPDALLVARRDQVSSDIKQLIEKLKDDHSELL